MHLTSSLRAGLCVLVLATIAPLRAEPLGTAFTYQGRLQQGGSPAKGWYDFQFSLWDSASGGTLVGATRTVSAVAVSNGLFSVALDFGSVFQGDALWLELSTRTNGAGGFSALSPRQALTAAPHASYAARAGSAGVASLANSVAAGSITSAALAPGAVSQLGSPNGAFPNALQVSTNGWVGVGTNAPSAALQISGGAPLLSPVVYAEARDGTGSFTNLDGAFGLAVSTNLLAVVSLNENAVTLVDSSNNRLTYRSSFLQGQGSFTNLTGARGVAFGPSNLLAVAALNADAVTLVDASNPASPVWRAVLRHGVGVWDYLDGALAVAFRSNVLAIAADTANAITLANVANPAAPSQIVVIRNGQYDFDYLSGPNSLAFQGNLLAISAYYSHAVTLADVSDLASPKPLAVLRAATGYPYLGAPSALALDGTLLAVASFSSNAVTLVDVSTPAAPRSLAVLRDGSNGVTSLRGPVRLAFLHHQGRTLLAVTARDSDALLLFDVTDPTRPVPRGTFVHQKQPGLHYLDQPYGVVANANGQLAVAAFTSGGLTLLGLANQQVGLASDSWVGIGTTAPKAALDVVGDVLVEQANRFQVQAGRLELGNGAAALGRNSSALGYYTTASGEYATALGYYTTASGQSSTALGYDTTASGPYSTALGLSSIASGEVSFAAGFRAQATNDYCFVWADYFFGGDFNSTADNQFLIRATGGVGINTNNPSGAALNVKGTVRASYFQGDGSALTGLRAANLAGGNVTNAWHFLSPAGVGIGTNLPTDALLDVEGDLRLNDHALWLRGGADRNHGLAWHSTGSFGGSNPDGPVLFGCGGGALGTACGGTNVALRWDASRNVTVGNHLTLGGSLSVSNNLVVDYQNSNTGSVTAAAIIFGSSSGEGIASRRNSGNNQYGLDLYTGFIPRLSINNAGRVGIATTLPAYTLHVNGTAYCSSGAWSGSDARWKQNIQPLQGALSKVLALQGVSYEWRREEFPDRGFESGLQLGFIAQEVEPVLPEVVHTDAEGFKAIAYEKLTPVLTEAIKEQQRQLQAQQAQIQALEAQNAQLTASLAELKALVNTLVQPPRGVAQ